MKILFISRAYPPVVGGIENQNFELGEWLGKIAEVEIIANKRGKKFLPFFLPYAAIKAIFNASRFDAILLGDVVLAVVGFKVKLFHKKPVICVAHGLDLTFKNSFYQKIWINLFAKKIDKFIAVGNETVKVSREKGIPENKIAFIPNGVDVQKFSEDYDRTALEKIIKGSIENKKFILTSGRLAKRKGVAWFCENIVPKLPENIVYIIAGDGPDKKNIRTVIQKNNLQNRVKMLGYVSDEERNILLNTCDIFVQPNIKIPGDMEGFGISVIEAALCKIPVLASNLEGLKDAIKDGQNGFLVESENVQAWISKTNELLANDVLRFEFGKKARQYVIDNFSWKIIVEKYFEEIKSIILKYKP